MPISKEMVFKVHFRNFLQLIPIMNMSPVSDMSVPSNATRWLSTTAPPWLYISAGGCKLKATFFVELH